MKFILAVVSSLSILMTYSQIPSSGYEENEKAKKNEFSLKKKIKKEHQKQEFTKQRTEYQVFNEDGFHYQTYIKIAEKNKVSFTNYNLNNKYIYNITIDTTFDSKNKKRLKYQYNYVADKSQLKSAKTIKKFVNRNEPLNLKFKNRENWTYFITNDTLYRYDLEESVSDLNNSPSFTLFSYFEYLDSSIVVENYSIGTKNFEYYSTDSILIKNDGNFFKRFHFRFDWDKEYILNLNINDSIYTYSNDEKKYTDITYLYNNDPFWKKIYYLTAGEKAIYYFDVIDFENKLLKSKYDYLDDIQYRNEIIYDLKNRISEIRFYKNENLYKTIKINYT